MTAPEGYFYAAQDADSFITPDDLEPEEGAFYVWDYAELAEYLTAGELEELSEQFMISPKGNFEGKIVLQRRSADHLSPSLETALAKLFTVRYGATPEALPTFPPARNNQEAKQHPWSGRIPAVTDTKMIVAWNSLMISGLARSAEVLQRAEYLGMAIRAAQLILDQQWVNGRLHRVNYDGNPHIMAQSEDYALLIKALLDLEQASLAIQALAAKPPLPLPSPRVWLDRAVQVQAEFDEFLWSIELGGYYNTDARADLVVRERGTEDHATPSANGVAIANLVRLSLLTEDLSYRDRAEQALQSFGQVMTKMPQVCPSLFAALDWFRVPTLVRSSPEHLLPLSQQYLPTAVYRIEPELPAGTIGLVCQGLSCNEPARSPEQLQAQIHQSLVRS
jgi:uncharacterized protein YyaL (SSP411 family)